MPWYERDPHRWVSEQRIANEVLQNFRSGITEVGRAFVEGGFRIKSQHGHTYDTVEIRIEYPPNFPRKGQTPKVVLLSHHDKWKPIADAHIFSDWSLCLYVPREAPVDFDKDDSLNALFAVLQSYLFKQRLFQRDLAREILTGVAARWPGDDRSHGVEGIAEAIHEVGRIMRNELCPCGSGRKFKKCCMQQVWEVRNGEESSKWPSSGASARQEFGH